MMRLYQVVELAATLCENAVVLCAISEIGGKKGTRKQYLWGTLLAIAIHTVFISIFNSFSPFSFITIGISLTLAVLLTGITSKGSILLRSTACILTYSVIHAMDYVVLFLFCMAMATPVLDSYSFSILLDHGTDRCLYLLVDKLLGVLLFFVLRHAFPKIRQLKKNYCKMLLVISILVYITMSLQIGLIMGKSLFVLQTAVMLSWVFSILCVFFVVALLYLTTSYQAEKQAVELLYTTDKLMTENYQQLYTNQQALARQIHDFNHHIKVIQLLATQEGAKETSAYTQSLLKSSYQERKFCKSGNHIVDAIINCKAMEAEKLSIAFTYDVRLLEAIDVDPVDICAILSNQLENAFESCERLSDSSKRAVSVDIWPKNNQMVFFRVANYVEENPLASNPKLHSTKEDSRLLHGLGLKNIADTAAKYGGALSNTYQDHCFVSTIFLSVKTF